VTGSNGPYDHPPSAYLDGDARRELLDQALAGVERGTWDERVITWLVNADTPTIRSVVGLVTRARATERRERPKPLRGGNLTDMVTLLTLCRDALDRGHGDLARAVLHLVVEHQGELGLRSRNLARTLAEQMAERDRPPKPPEPTA
jgi:hypothetical protein